MDISRTAQTEIVNRLKRAEGQIHGVIGMIEDGKSCRDVVMQLSAASKAVTAAAYKLISSSMQQCFLGDSADPEMSPEELEKLFIRFA